MKTNFAITGMPPQTGKSAEFGWLGIPAVLAAIAVNLRLSSSRQPTTSLRMLSLIAITAALRARGIVLCPERRQAMIDAMELGALLNDRFDGDPYDLKALRARVAGFARSAHRDVVRSYAKQLRQFERSRPNISNHHNTAVKQYRESVNRISLALLWALGCARSLRVAELEIDQEADLRLLFQIVMLAQVIDDMLDVHEDSRRGLPSFATDGMSPAEIISVYADASPIRLDRHFCLRVALRIITAGARIVVMKGPRTAI